jgi:hypothetical protein
MVPTACSAVFACIGAALDLASVKSLAQCRNRRRDQCAPQRP